MLLHVVMYTLVLARYSHCLAIRTKPELYLFCCFSNMP